MEGVADEARMYVFLLFIAVFMRLGFEYPLKKTISAKAYH